MATADGKREGWLSAVRILFAWYLLTFGSVKSAIAVEALPETYFNPPLGPFMLLNSAPNGIIIFGLQVAATLGLMLLLIGYRTALVSYVVPILFIVLAGIRFSTGKIDHDVLLYLLPLFLARSWGTRLSLRPERYLPPRLDVLALFVGFFFLTSGILKASTGWLDLDYSATAGWLAFYQTNYGVETVLASWLSDFSGAPLELLDWLTVLLECSILPLLFFRRTVAVALLMCLSFNIGVVLLFGINFSELFPVYLALLPLAIKAVEKLTYVVAGGLLLATVIIANLGPLIGGAVTFGPFGLKVPMFWVFAFLMGIVIAYTVIKSLRTEAGANVSLKTSMVVLSLLSVPLLITVLWTEPYPAIIGPGFRGGITGELKQVWIKDGQEVRPSEVFGGSPYSTNIGFYGWPSPQGQGHEYRPWDAGETPELPEGVTVEWVRVR
ncbi:hypothetical protein GCM10009655_00510 [Rhodoglobus aureus]|uniref:HTTM domain-containing protein n=2 Tax=Rhodoglobus aureus TaxID=191497 RepID=A0ABN1VCI9_9MICO